MRFKSEHPYHLLIGAVLSAACTANPATVDEGLEGGEQADRGPLGKADQTGSCSGDDGDLCGGKSHSNCWCDELCESYGDCCSDYEAICLDETGGDDGGGEADLPGELVFTDHKLADGWYQYEGLQYRPAGEFFSTVEAGPDTSRVFFSGGLSNRFRAGTGRDMQWSWEQLDVNDSYSVRAVATATDLQGHPLALIAGKVYHDYPHGNPGIGVFRFDGYKWHKHAISVYYGSSSTVNAAAMAVDGDGIHVVYSGRSEVAVGDGVVYVHFDGQSWSEEVIAKLPTPLEQRTVALELDDDGRPHVSFVERTSPGGPYDASHVLHYAVRESGAWTTEVAESYILARAPIDLALGPDGEPALVYADDKNSDVFVTQRNGGAWNRENVVAQGDVGWGTSLAFDDLGRMHIAWWDKEERTLGYARRLASGWDIYPEAASPNIGHYSHPNQPIYTDLLVDGERLPHVTVGSFDLYTVAGARP